MHYVSITGFRVRSAWHLPGFFWHAVRSMRQAQAADGNVLAEAQRIEGVFHTLSVWRDRKAMLAYLTTGAHRKAMAASVNLGAGYACGFEGDLVPDWAEVHALWLEEGVRRANARQTAA